MDHQRLVKVIITDIDAAISRLTERSIIDVSSFIVGCTWCREEDIVELDSYYPKLITIADPASDLETMNENDVWTPELWEELLINLKALKEQVSQEK